MGYSCFVISPIGEPDSLTRINADNVLEFIIDPVMQGLGFDKPVRGDQDLENEGVFKSVIENVKKADVCIVDLTDLNQNVMFELGYRLALDKPTVVLYSAKTDISKLPADVRNLKAIKYNFDGINFIPSVRSAKSELTERVKHWLDDPEKYFEPASTAVSYATIATSLQTLERNVNRILAEMKSTGTRVTSAAITGGELPEGLSSRQAFVLGLKQENIPLIDTALKKLEYQTDKVQYYDLFVSVAAARGSQYAGGLLLKNFEELMDLSVEELSIKKKYEMLGCLVNYLNRNDLEEEYAELIEKKVERIKADCEMYGNDDLAQDIMAGAYNQLQRLYHGAYQTADKPEYLKKAYKFCNKAIEMKNTEPAYFFNKSIVEEAMHKEGLNDKDYLHEAELSVIEMMKRTDREKPDTDHLQRAYRIFRQTGNDEQLAEVTELLQKHNPLLLQLAKARADMA